MLTNHILEVCNLPTTGDQGAPNNSAPGFRRGAISLEEGTNLPFPIAELLPHYPYRSIIVEIITGQKQKFADNLFHNKSKVI